MRTILCVLASLCVACAPTPDVPSEGRGSATCHLWQDSVCDWAERCNALSRGACDEQFQAVTCRSDPAAAQCADEFQRASCLTGADRCGLSEIADPVPAERACDQLMNRFCEHVVACGQRDTQANCVANVMQDVDCSRSVAYTLEFETCLESIDEMQCESMALPAICNDVIIARSE